MRQHFAGAHVHHDAAGADGAELVHRLGQLVAHHRLHAHIERQAQRIGSSCQALIEEALHPGDTVAVHIDPAQHLGGDTAERVVAALGGFEIDARNAQRIDPQTLPAG